MHKANDVAAHNQQMRTRAVRLLEQALNDAATRPGTTEVRLRVPVHQNKLSRPRASIEQE